MSTLSSGLKQVIFCLTIITTIIKVKSDKGTPQYYPDSTSQWVTYIPGDGPIVLISGHDGTLNPSEIPIRTVGCWTGTACDWTCNSGTPSPTKCKITTSRDTRANDIGICVQNTATFFVSPHTFHPHLIYNNVIRTRIDMNRDLTDGACNGDSDCEATWHAFHNYIDSAINNAITNCDFAIVIDLHGHNQNNFSMFGYDIDENQYGDNITAAPGPNSNLNDEKHSTILGLKYLSGSDIATIVRGSNSLGTLLTMQRSDYRSIPSQQYPNPNYEKQASEYFQGDYIVDTYGSGNSLNGYFNKSDSIQLEIPQWIRTSNQLERDLFCQGLSNALILGVPVPPPTPSPIISWIDAWHSTRKGSCHIPSRR